MFKALFLSPRPRVAASPRRFCFVSLCVLMSGTCLGAEARVPANLKEVVVVFKTHFDIGYTDLARNVVQNYRTTMIDKALGVCDATRDLPAGQQFVWTLSGWPLTQILWPGQDRRPAVHEAANAAARRQRIEDAIRGGRFVWHALPATTHTESLEPEDVVRGLRFSTDLARAYSQPLPRDAKMTDVPSHCWVLPTILANAGVEFLHLGCNGASTPPQAPPLFWWEGPDGSRVMTMLVRGYGTGLLPPQDWPYQTWLALMHTGDNHGPPAPEEVKKLLADAAAKLPGVKVRMGRLSDFADAIRREDANLPVVRADMPDSWIHGIMSHPIDTAVARRVRPRIGQLEELNTLMKAWGADVPDVKHAVASAFEQSLLYGEHTWGMDAKRFPRLYGKAWEEGYAKGTYAKAEESWAEHGHYIQQAAEIVEPALADHLGKLAANVSVPGPRVVVYNPLPGVRTDVVTVKWPAGSAGAFLREADGRQTIPTQANGDTVQFIARDLPAMGYKTYVLEKPQDDLAPLGTDPAQNVIQNGAISVKLDPARGGIVSLFDKTAGRELLAEGQVLGQYLYQTFDADDPKRYVGQYAQGTASWIEGDFGKPGLPPASQAPRKDVTAGSFDLRFESGPISARAIMTAQPTEALPHAVSLAVTIYRDLPYIDLEWSIKDKPPTPWPEAGWLCLPFAAKNASYRLGRPGAIIDPTRDIQPSSNFDVFCLNSGMTIGGEGGALVGLCPLDSPLVSIGKPGLWQFTKKFQPAAPTVYVNLYNNQWSTNFSQWVGGSWSSRVRIWAGRDNTVESILAVAATEARCPALAAAANGPAGNLPTSATGLSVSRPGITVTALGPSPDGNGTLLRVWEQSGQGGPCTVTLPSGSVYKIAQPCNLRGQPSGSPLAVADGRLAFDLKPFSPKSFVLKAE